MKRDKKRYIDGVDNIDYWKGKSAVSRRDDFLYCYESRLTAVRMGPWKMHFSTREDYYDTLQGRTAPLLFNLRSDPFETYDNKDSFGHLGQRASWVFQPIVEHVLEHLKAGKAAAEAGGGPGAGRR